MNTTLYTGTKWNIFYSHNRHNRVNQHMHMNRVPSKPQSTCWLEEQSMQYALQDSSQCCDVGNEAWSLTGVTLDHKLYRTKQRLQTTVLFIWGTKLVLKWTRCDKKNFFNVDVILLALGVWRHNRAPPSAVQCWIVDNDDKYTLVLFARAAGIFLFSSSSSFLFLLSCHLSPFS